MNLYTLRIHESESLCAPGFMNLNLLKSRDSDSGVMNLWDSSAALTSEIDILTHAHAKRSRRENTLRHAHSVFMIPTRSDYIELSPSPGAAAATDVVTKPGPAQQ